MLVVDAPSRILRWADRAVVIGFGAALFSGAALMFLLEPMAAKAVLPMLGGAPAVWNTCVVFFQLMLLAGYAYAHAGTQWLGVQRHAALHALLLFLSVFALRNLLELPEPDPSSNPTPWLLMALTKSIGLPFFLLATTAPLLQKWFSHTRHRTASDPYFLYVSSNAGSLVGLLLFPLLVEPMLPLRAQATYWSYGYVALTLMVLGCAVVLRQYSRVSERRVSPASSLDGAASRPSPSTLRRVKWVALAFAPSSLMLAVTTFVSTDLAAVPLLWVLPLALYLLSFVFAFSSSPRYPRSIIDRSFVLLILALVLLFDAIGPLRLVLPLHLSVFFLAALICHRELADDRPDPAHLTGFYLLVAFGGVLGSMFNTLAAPLLFTGIVEYPLVLVLACLLRHAPSRNVQATRMWRIAVPPAVAATAAAIALTGTELPVSVRLLLLSVPAFLCLSVSRTRAPFAAAVGAMLFASILKVDALGNVLHAERTFFGSYRVHLDAAGEYRSLTHGTTIHGLQRISGPSRPEPLSYFHRTGPLGDVFATIPAAYEHDRVAIVGLGVGSVAAYRNPAQTYTFLEIDPAVERIARMEEYFSYLSECGVACRVVIGDARQSLRADSATYGAIVLDAFSSDAIPIHLVTREAVDLYLARLAPGGVLAFHISNRHIDLEPVLARLAEDLRLVSFIRRDLGSHGEHPGKKASAWVLMAREAGDLGSLSADSRWRRAETEPSVRTWTDDFSNIVTLLLRK